MKVSIKIASILVICLSTACRKVINIDLNSSAPSLIIEGIVSNSTSIQTVLLSKSNNFSDNNSFPAVSGARVILSDNLGNVDTLTESAAGTYTGSKITGKPGVTYSLYVNAGGKAYTAQSVMPPLVHFDTLVVLKQSFFGQTGYYPQILFYDPAAEQNYYRFVISLNGKRTVGYNIYDDRFSNGTLVNRIMNVQVAENDKDPAMGDTYEVKMSCISKAVYTYFYSLQQSQNGDSGAPDNPVTNINGGALGYFSAQTDQVRTVTIK